jgi:hypothetical protein
MSSAESRHYENWRSHFRYWQLYNPDQKQEFKKQLSIAVQSVRERCDFLQEKLTKLSNEQEEAMGSAMFLANCPINENMLLKKRIAGN